MLELSALVLTVVLGALLGALGYKKFSKKPESQQDLIDILRSDAVEAKKQAMEAANKVEEFKDELEEHTDPDSPNPVIVDYLDDIGGG